MRKACFGLPDGRALTWYETGCGRPLVLLHGWAMSAAVFRETASMLAADFRLLIPDLPGHGESAPPPRMNFAQLAADLTSWLASTVNGPIVLGGWSLGGMLAIELARQGRIPVERLVLIGTTPRFTCSDGWQAGLPPGQVRAMERNLAQHYEKTLADFFALAFVGEDIPPVRRREIKGFAVLQSPVPDRDSALSLLKFLAVQDQRSAVSQIRLPALILHGELDQITPVEAGRCLAEMLPGGKFVEFPGVGHVPFLSSPREFARRVREFANGPV